MSIDITQGRYLREAVKDMIVRPEDRVADIARSLSWADLAPGFKSAGGA